MAIGKSQPVDGYVTYGGFKLHYLEWGKSGRDIVALHSMMMDAHSFDFLAQSLSSSNRILAIDLLGHGDSDKPTDAVSFEKHVEVIRGVVKEREFSGLVLIGHSVGGFISMLYASKYPSEVSKVILVDIAPRDPSLKRVIRERPSSFRSRDELTLYLKSEYPNFSEASIENRLKHGFKPSDNRGYVWKADPKSSEMVRASFMDCDFWPHIKNIKAPILLVKGAQSETVSSNTMERMRRELRDFHLIEIEGAGHQVPLDRPKEFEHVIREFLTRS